MYPVALKSWPDREVAALPHTGAYDRIGETFGRLDALMREHGLQDAITGPAVGVYHDNPQEVPAADLRSHAGVIVGPGTALPEGLERVILPGGQFAVLTMHGPFDGLPAAWAWLYGQWLPECGKTLADRPPFELYPDDMATTPAADRRTLICVPVV